MSEYKKIGTLENVIKSFGEVVALSDISFSIERGQISGFLGPNGSGKTTSIQLLLGLSRPSSGKTTLFGVDPFTNSQVNNLVGYISEEGIFPRWMTAFDYLYSLARFNMNDEEAKTRAEEVLKEIELEDVADKHIRKFSKGMRQRIKIGQALISKPALIVGDEPFNGLDPVVRAHMFDLFRKYNQEYNTTFFISTHILFEVERLADKIILVYKGRTIAQGSPQRIREMIHDQPHTIQIISKNSREMARVLVDNCSTREVSSINFIDGTMDEGTLQIKTLEPKLFYNKLTDLVLDHHLSIQEVRPTDEGLETLFKSLTIG
jgi:ABC-2 type transport system ATP-binding protein